MKYNLGCGNDYRCGWVNVDRAPDVAPDVVWDLGTFPWPFETGSADEVILIHVLDEMALGSEALPRIMRELHRICRDGTKVTVRNTDPRHADAALKPLGSGGLAPTAFHSYDLATVEAWLASGERHTPSALYAKVDFAVQGSTVLLDERWRQALQAGGVADQALTTALLGQNNVAACSEVVMEARKPFAPGRSLREADALVLERHGGLGDVLMLLATCRAIKSVSDRPIYLLVNPPYRAIAALCPHVDGAFSDEGALRAHAASRGQIKLKHVNLCPVRFGLSRLHQIDAYLQALALTPDDREKALDLDLSRTTIAPWIDARLASLPANSARVVLHPGLSDPNRTWDGAFWADLAEHCLAQGHSVITVGQNNGPDGKGAMRIAHERIIDFTDQINIAETLHVMRHSDVFVSADSGPIQLAGASEIGIIGLYSVVGGEQRLPYRNGFTHHRAAAVLPDCAFSPCYRWMTDPDVASAYSARTRIGFDQINEFMANWCVAPEIHACTREANAGDKVKALIPALLARIAVPDAPQCLIA